MFSTLVIALALGLAQAQFTPPEGFTRPEEDSPHQRASPDLRADSPLQRASPDQRAVADSPHLQAKLAVKRQEVMTHLTNTLNLLNSQLSRQNAAPRIWGVASVETPP